MASTTEIEDNIVKTVVPGLTVPEEDFADYLVPVLKKYGEKICLIDGVSGKSLTCSELVILSAKLAGALQRHGAERGDFITVHSRSTLDFWIAFLAAVRIGCVVVLAKPSLNSSELYLQLNDAKPTFLIFEEIYHEKILELKDQISFIKEIFVSGTSDCFVSLKSMVEDNDCARFEPHRIVDSGTAPLLIAYSSGTTGVPKGVVHSHRSILSFLAAIGPKGTSMVSESDIILATAPATHISGIVMGLTNFQAGATSVLLPDFDVRMVLEAIDKYKVTRLPCFPTKVQQLLNSPLLPNYDLSTVDSYITAGSACPKAVFETLIKTFNLKEIFHVYGLSEVMVSCTAPKKLEHQHAGKPFPFSELKIADEATGQALPTGSQGEIRVRSPLVLLGYLHLPEVTASLFDEEGFLKTGDIGYCDEDGNLYITDRIKDLVKCMDQQASPTEVEDFLVQHDAVKQAAVVGIPHESYGETLRAFVILKPGDKGTTAKELIDFVAERCSFHKRLHGGVEFVDHLPTNDIGKYLRREIRQNYLQKLSESKSM